MSNEKLGSGPAGEQEAGHVSLAATLLPPGHLGLEWAVNDPGELVGSEILPEIQELHSQSQEASRPRLPLPYLQRLYLPEGHRHVTLVGRDRNGVLRAIGTVKCHASGSGDVRDVCVVRAIVAPSWRGRGLGRAILHWQYDAATAMLKSPGPNLIAAPLAAGNLERRRLYAAAGYSALYRLETLGRALGDAPEPLDNTVPVELAPGWVARAKTDSDTEELVHYLSVREPDPHSFAASGLTPRDAVEIAHGDISRVYLKDGELAGVALGIQTTDGRGRRHGMMLQMRLSGMVERDVRIGALYDATNALWTKGMHEATIQLTPAGQAEWGGVLQDHAWTTTASDPLYGIEL